MQTLQQPNEQQQRRQQRAAQPQQQRQQHSTQLPDGLYMQQQQYMYQDFQQQVSAYTQQHARPQQRKKAPVSGSRRQRSDAGVPRGPRAKPNAEDAQQQAWRMDAEFRLHMQQHTSSRMIRRTASTQSLPGTCCSSSCKRCTSNS